MTHKLDIDWQGQGSNLWCWAACISMVLEALDRGEKQCHSVNRLPGRADCCPGPRSDSPCGDALIPVRVQEAWKTVGIETEVEKRLDTQDVKDELLDQRPVMIGVGSETASFDTGNGHAVLAYGFGSDLVYVHDPAGNDSLLGTASDFSDVLSPYVWRWTWRGLPRVDVIGGS